MLWLFLRCSGLEDFEARPWFPWLGMRSICLTVWPFPSTPVLWVKAGCWRYHVEPNFGKIGCYRLFFPLPQFHSQFGRWFPSETCSYCFSLICFIRSNPFCLSQSQSFCVFNLVLVVLGSKYTGWLHKDSQGHFLWVKSGHIISIISDAVGWKYQWAFNQLGFRHIQTSFLTTITNNYMNII